MRVECDCVSRVVVVGGGGDGGSRGEDDAHARGVAPGRVGKSTTRVRRAWTTATTAVAYTHARDISHHISPSFSRVVTRASNVARRTAAPIMARRWLTLTRTRAIFATVGSPTTMALTTTPSAMAVPSRAATKNTCTYANDLIRELARVERDATADDGRRYPATARRAWV